MRRRLHPSRLVVLWFSFAVATPIACRAPVAPAPSPLAAQADSAARAALAREATLDPATYPARIVGVAPLAVSTTDTLLAPLGFGLADLIITDLGRSAQLEVVDRVRIDALLRELQLASTGSVDSATAPRVGKLAGARRLLVGALATAPGGELHIETRVADAATGSLSGAVSVSMPLARILDAEKQLVYRIFEQLGVTLTPAERAAVEQRPTENVAALLAYSRAVRDEVLGDFGSAQAQYESAVQLDAGFSVARTRLSELRARADQSGGRGAGGSSLLRAAANATEGINRGAPLPVSEAADGPVLGARQLTTLVIVISSAIRSSIP